MLGMARWGAVVAVVAGCWAGWSPPARACGGFFCDGATPVNQAAERIIFAQHGDGTVTAVIQVLYEGPAEEFSWVLPVPGVPEVQVSSDVAFQRLQVATNPQYQLNTQVEGTCGSTRDDSLFASPPASTTDAGVASDAEEGPGVVVEHQGHVGPYDYVVISLDPEHEHPGDAAVEWLQDNGYDVDDLGRDRLGPYLAGGQNLIAFRLSKNRDAGSIRPIRLTFGQGAPVIPIQPTAVAAVDNMGVMVWVLGPSRAVPINYLALELNEALLNWFNPNTNYNDVVSAAADEAGGHGFVTEMAGPASALSDVVVGSWELGTWDGLSPEHPPLQIVEQTVNAFGTWDGFADVFTQHVPPPAGVSESEFLACPGCYLHQYTDELEGMDRAGYLHALAVEVVEPMVETQTLLDGAAYSTRLYTTLSAHEMTVDPMFDFNPDLPDAPRLRTATRIIECSSKVTQWEAPWRVELTSGDVVRGEGTGWPLDFQAAGMPLNRRILDMSTRGEGILVNDNTDAIQAALAEHNATVPPPPTGGCSVGGAAAPGMAAGLAAALTLLLAVRRRWPA